MDGAVTLRVPPGTPSGRKLRARGKGVVRRSGRAGDLLVTVEVTVPDSLSEQARAAFGGWGIWPETRKFTDAGRNAARLGHLLSAG